MNVLKRGGAFAFPTPVLVSWLVVALMGALDLVLPGSSVRGAESDASSGSTFLPVVLPPSTGGPTASIPSGAPSGVQTFNGVRFQVRHPLALTGLEDARQGKLFPAQIRNISVGRKAGRVHLLHGSDGDERDGIPLGAVVLRYAGGEQRTLRIAYGVHVRSLVPSRGESDLVLYDPNSALAWQGGGRQPGRGPSGQRWFQTALSNPLPDEVIASIELISLFGRPTWTLYAVTLQEGATGDLEPLPTNRRMVKRAFEFEDDVYRRDIVVRTIDPASNQPVTGASASLSITDAESTFYFGREMADANGLVRLVYPPQHAAGLTVVVKALGRLPFVHVVTNAASEGVRTQLVAALATGRRIGGVVRAVSGEPISNATVTAYHLREENPRAYTRMDYDAILTDAAGRWSTAAAPEVLDGFHFQISHPEFRSATVSVVPSKDYPRQGQWKPEDLAGLKAEARLAPALRLAGTVVEGSGKPIPQAQINVIDTRSGNEVPRGDEMTAQADSAGHFRFFIAQPGQYMLLVQAEGYAPKMQPASLDSSGAEPVAITLASQRKMTGSVRDQDQQPIPGARVRLESWNDTQWIQFEAQADERGQFVWENVPEGSLRFYVSATNHSSTTYSIAGNPGEQRFTLRKLSRVSGLVVDAETKKPIEEFTVFRGRAYNPDEPIRWERYNAFRGRRGEYNVRLVEYSSSGRTAILIEAPGYMPVASQAFTKPGAYTNNFELQPARGLAGKVVNRAGEPVAGATVVLVDAGENVYMERSGELRRSSDGGAYVRSDRQGAFEFPAKLDPHTVLAAHAEGFAEVRVSNFLAAGVIQLQPWARIEGTLKVGLKGDRAPELRLQNTFYRYTDSSRQSQPLSLYVSAEVGPQGEFVFPRVPPGERRVALNYYVRIGNSGRSSTSHGYSMILQPGQSTNVTIGGSGRLVKGRVKVAGGDDEAVDWKRDFHTLNPQRELRMNIPPPDMSKARTPEQQQAVWARQRALENEFWRSEAGRAYERGQTSYVLQFETNGTFHVESVPPGKYQLSISPTDPTRDDYSYEQIGSLSHDVVIPEAPASNPGEPLDLGTFELKIRGTMRVGKRAPAMEMTTFDGKPVKLADYAGKHVLLDFWATWSGARTLEVQTLKAVHDLYARDERLVMIGVNFDHARPAAEEALKTAGLKWTQCFGGPWGESAIRESLGLRGLPDALLIDPQGRVSAMNLRGPNIRRTIERILGPPKT